ncbi:MAG: transporter substrate-binding domain-containing protein [Desulfobacterales bacterium]|nr:transporter substrate-binding domain-containing protein [Desulfobacterales bacterium]
MKKVLLLTVLVVVLFSGSAFGQKLQIAMDYYPPFSYEENGEIKGLSTLVVRAALKQAGMEAIIKQYPFARAYNMTQKTENIFEYCVVKTPERTLLFKWVGIVGPAVQTIFAPKDKNIKIDKPEGLKGYRIGTVIEDVVDQYLSARKDKLGLQLDRVSSYKSNMKKMLTGRVDLWGGNKLVGYYLAKELGYSEDAIKPVYIIDELTDHYYLVTGLKTSDKLVQKIRKAFETIHNNGTYQKIVDEYFK